MSPTNNRFMIVIVLANDRPSGTTRAVSAAQRVPLVLVIGAWRHPSASRLRTYGTGRLPRCQAVRVAGPFIKRRDRPAAGSIPDVLQMFVAEVRFYREIAPVVGVRVPACLLAEVNAGATLLLLEDLSDWEAGADAAGVARVLADLHARWSGIAPARWPWLRTPNVASELVGALFDQTWPGVAGRPECTQAVRALGDRLFGHIPAVERTAARAGPTTLVHGDASLPNVRSSSTGEIALLDWEDVGAAPGVADLALWWCLPSTRPTGTKPSPRTGAPQESGRPSRRRVPGDLVPRGHSPWLRPGEQLGSAARGSGSSDELRPDAAVP